jgi:hypothetical protein
MEVAARAVALPRLGFEGLMAARAWRVLVPLVVAQWLALLAFSLIVRHNGWLYYEGGDETFYYTTAWAFAGWHLPTAPVGYGWSYLLSPVALFTGPNILTALPPLLLIDALVLLPVATLCVYGIASRVGGRLVGYLATLLWVIAPYAAIPLWDPRYHQKWTEIFLPQALGLTNMADFPSMVLLLVAAYFCVRALDGREVHDGILAGLIAGFAVGVKPSNGIFLAAPLLAFAAARAWRQLAPFVGGLVLPLVALAVWKERGLGHTPALAAGDPHLAYLGLVAPPLMLVNPVTRYVHVDWAVLAQNLDGLREFFWSVRPLEYLPIAGAVAVLLRSAPKGVFLASWFFAYLFIKGSSPQARVEDGSFFRLMMPAFPAYLVLASSLPLLVPTVGSTLAERFGAPAPRRIVGNRWLAVAIAVFGVVPLLLLATMRSQRTPIAIAYFDQGTFLPVDKGFHVDATVRGRRVVLSWRSPGGWATPFYRVFRQRPYHPDPFTSASQPFREGLRCNPPKTGHGASFCEIQMDVLATGPTRTFGDTPPPGRWSYRIGMAANWLDDPNFGDVLMLSAPVTVTVPSSAP